MQFNHFAVPDGIAFSSFEERIIEDHGATLSLRSPCLSSEDIVQLMQTIRENRQKIKDYRTDQLIQIIDAAIQKWLDPNYPLRQFAEKWVPIITGYDKNMVRLELKQFLRLFRKKELLRFIQQEFPSISVLDEFYPQSNGGWSRAYGPEFIFHIFSGNVPGLPIWSLVMGILLKSANFGKIPTGEPLMAILFAQSLREVNVDVANTLAILPWKGGNQELEAPLYQGSDTVIAYGSNETVEQIRKQIPSSTRFLHYGYKISFAMVGREALRQDLYRDTLRRLRDDMTIYDQQACLSPHLVFIEAGGNVSPRMLAQQLSSELQQYALIRTRAKLSPEESQAIRSLRNEYEFKAMTNPNVAVYQSEIGTEWTVIYHKDLSFQPSPLNRTIHVVQCEHLEESIPAILPFREYLQTVGIATHPTRLMHLSGILGEQGVTRICAIGSMNRSVPGWHHDGRFNLIDLVRWVDLEGSAEALAEQYDLDVE